MSIKIFRFDKNGSEELEPHSVEIEKDLQNHIEKNLETFLGVRFLATEYSTGKTHSGRIDTLGIDENGSPVIIEYKRTMDQNVISQGLYYIGWLLDHRAELELLVMSKLGKNTAAQIDWNGVRMICIAGDFTKYDEHAIKQIGRKIELIKFRYFGNDLLLLESNADDGCAKAGKKFSNDVDVTPNTELVPDHVDAFTGDDHFDDIDVRVIDLVAKRPGILTCEIYDELSDVNRSTLYHRIKKLCAKQRIVNRSSKCYPIGTHAKLGVK